MLYSIFLLMYVNTKIISLSSTSIQFSVERGTRMFKSGKFIDKVSHRHYLYGETSARSKPGSEEEPYDEEEENEDTTVVEIVAPPVTRRLIMGAEDHEEMNSERLILAAAAHGNLRALEDLIKDAANLNIKDELGRTPIHLAASIDCSCSFCIKDAVACTKLLLMSTPGAHVINIQDDYGNTPLHLTIETRNQRCAQILINAGADLFIRNNDGKTCLSLILDKLPHLMQFVLDKTIMVNQFEPTNEKCVLQIDFRCVICPHKDDVKKNPAVKSTCSSNQGGSYRKASSFHSQATETPFFSISSSSSTTNTNAGTLTGVIKNTASGVHSLEREMGHLSSILEERDSKSARDILTHPVSLIFLDQKWRCAQPYFILSFISYMVWLLCYTSCMLRMYAFSCPTEPAQINSSRILGTSADSQCTNYMEVDVYLILTLVLSGLLAWIEMGKFLLSPKFYLKNTSNIFYWCVISLIFVVTAPLMIGQSSFYPVQYHIAAVSLICAWGFVLIQLSRFYMFAIYLFSCAKVLKTIAVYCASFSPIVIASAVGLAILFPQNTQLSPFLYFLSKATIMMSGEIEYDKMMEKQHGETSYAHFVYFCLVLFTTIVLANLLISLIVSEIQTVKKSAEFAYVSNLLLECEYLESLAFSSKVPIKIANWLKTQVLITNPDVEDKHKCLFTFQPNIASDHSVRSDLKHKAWLIAAKLYDVERSFYCSKGCKSGCYSSTCSSSASASPEPCPYSRSCPTALILSNGRSNSSTQFYNRANDDRNGAKSPAACSA